MTESLTIRQTVAGTDTVQALDLSFRLRAEAALALFDCEVGSRVIEVGCGIGSFAALLAARSLHVTCVDVSEANIETVRREHPELEAVLADGTALPFDANTFDAAIFMEVLEHIEDDRRGLAEISRVLCDNGLLIISVPNSAAPPPWPERLQLRSVHAREGPEHHFRDGYAPEALTRILQDSGFRIETMTSVGGTAYRLATGVVSLVHIGYRRLRGQPSWGWADVEADRGSRLTRIYGFVFPAFLAFARLGARGPGMRGATLLARARALPADHGSAP